MVNEMNTGGDEGEIKVKMVLSAEDFARVLERMPSPLTVEGAAGAGSAGTGGAGSTEAKTRGMPINLEKAVRTSPTFMSIFKPVAAMAGINLGIQGILASSRVAQGYLGAMGKMFGAAVDLLMMPFIPLFNAILLGMSMLVQWLITSGLLEAISKAVLNFMEFVKNDIAPHLKAMWEALTKWDWEKVADEFGGAVAALGVKIIAEIDEKMGGPGKQAQQWFEKIPFVGDKGAQIGNAAQTLVGEAAIRQTPLQVLRDVGATMESISGIKRLTEGKLPTGGQAMAGLSVAAPGLSVVARTASALFNGGGGDSKQQQQQAAARAFTDNSNKTYNITATDPVAVMREIERLQADELSKAGWEGKP